MKIRLLLLLTVSLNACALLKTVPRPSLDELQKADYGEAPHRYLDRIKTRLASNLDNPNALRLVCADPAKGWVMESPVQFGWLIACQASSKRVFGYPINERQQVFFFRDNDLAQSLTWENAIDLGGKRYGFARDGAIEASPGNEFGVK